MKFRSRTTQAPKSHTELGFASAEVPFGHVAGHRYLDVNVVVSKRGGRYRCLVVETFGSAQGFDDEEGRIEVIGRGDSIAEAVRVARERALEAQINSVLLVRALSLAEDEAEEAADDDADD